MTNINFDEQSIGQVHNEGEIGLRVIAHGKKAEAGIRGDTTDLEGGPGVIGTSKKWIGVYGATTEAGGHAGVRGDAQHPEGLTVTQSNINLISN